MNVRTFSVLSVAILLGGIGVACQTSERAAVTPRTQTTAQRSAPAPTTVTTDGRIRSSYAFPTGHHETSVLMLDRDLPAEIVSGQEFSYSIKVTNIGHNTIDGVSLRDECASQIVLTKAEPAPLSEKPPFVWNLGTMKPGDSRTVRVFGKTTGREPFTSCASATYNSAVCLTSPIVEPALRVTASAPAEVTPCDPIPVRITVTNTGTGAVRDVRVNYPLPEGWLTTDGKKAAQFNLASLVPKQSHEFIANVKSDRAGNFTSRITATAWPELQGEAMPVPTAVRQALLAVKGDGPANVHPNRRVVAQFAITNNGPIASKDSTFEVPLPQNAKFISATEGGTLARNSVVWNLREIPSKARRDVSLTLEPTAMGTLDLTGTAKAYCADPARDSVSIAVAGVPALLLEVTDLVDPVEVYSNTTYEIVIVNQGTAEARNVRVAATLEDNQKFVSASAANTVVGQVITFAPIAVIAPKQKVTLTVVVQCVMEGDTRFKVSMTSDQLTRPVEETESTNIYR